MNIDKRNRLRAKKLENALQKEVKYSMFDHLGSTNLKSLGASVLSGAAFIYFLSSSLGKIPEIEVIQEMGRYLSTEADYLKLLGESLEPEKIHFLQSELSEKISNYSDLRGKVIGEFANIKEMVQSGLPVDQINSKVTNISKEMSGFGNFRAFGMLIGLVFSGITCFGSGNVFRHQVSDAFPYKKEVRKSLKQEYGRNMDLILDGPYASQALTCLERSWDKSYLKGAEKVEDVLKSVFWFSNIRDKDYASKYQSLLINVGNVTHYDFRSAFVSSEPFKRGKHFSELF